MGCGGAEKVMSRLSAHLVERGNDVQLLAVRPDPVFYPVHEKIDFQISNIPTPEDASLPARLMNFYRKVAWLRRYVKKSRPEIIISFTEVANCMMLAAAIGLKIPVIVSERVNPVFHPVPSIYEFLRKKLYPRADALVLQTEDLREWAAGWILESRVKVFPNPVDVPPERGANPADYLKDDRKTVVAMGRLVRQKGFDMLLEVFAGVDRSEWKLLIIGDGALRQQLEEMRKSLGMDNDVLMPGNISNPAPVLRKCDIFVMSSRYEGFPNALCEGMACGLPAVSFRCPSGPSDIIRHGVDGLLVPDGDVTVLADSIKILMNDGKKRQEMSKRSIEITDRYSSKKIMGMWDALIQETKVAART